MSTEHFYRELKPFHSFVDEAFDGRHYVALPADWLLIVADITDSTQAVQDGKYNEVNYLGAACIVSVTNAVREFDLPTVFGGDGATLAVPEAAKETTLAALLATKRWGADAFGLELRVGAVPISEIYERGATLDIAKMEFSPGNTMAMFRGDGFDLADTLVKEGDFAIDADDANERRPDLESLSCRWSPLESTNGRMLCLIIGATGESPAENDDTYRYVLETINGIASIQSAATSPVKFSTLRFPLRYESIRKDALTSGGPRWLAWIKAMMVCVVGAIVFKLKRKVGDFDPAKYMKETAINADFRKVNGMLRLILDCSETQCDQIEGALGELHARGKLAFGAHRATHAIMTCVAPNVENNEHVHYIDGSEGGLWSAAKGLKRQLKGIE